MKAWFRGIEKGRTVYQKIGYVDRCGTIGFLQGFSSFLFKRLVFLLLTINRPTVNSKQQKFIIMRNRKVVPEISWNW